MESYKSIWQNYCKRSPELTLDEYEKLQLEIAYLKKQLSTQSKVIRQLKQEAYTDELTKLWNRRKFQEDLEKTVQYNKRHGRQSAVFFIDLNQFKPINDTLGHLAGDSILQQVAKSLKQSCRGHDDVYRFGGDEFVIIMHDINADSYKNKTDFIHNTICNTTCCFNHQEICISASIGACLIDGRTSSEQVVEKADMQMYKVKQGNHMNLAS